MSLIVPADAFTSNKWSHGDASVSYVGPDHSSLEGAQALAKRLNDFWEAKGQPREHEVYRLRERSKHYGVRRRSKIPIAGPQIVAIALSPRMEIREAPREQIAAFIAGVLQEKHPAIPYECITGKAKTPKGVLVGTVRAARDDCIQAVRTKYGYSSGRIAKIFHVDSSTVRYAINPTIRVKKAAMYLKKRDRLS